MKNKTCIIALTLVMSLVTLSCELKKSNPLSVYTSPPKVSNLTATGSGASAVYKYIQLQWRKNTANTDGYYIYLGLAYNSAYAVVDTFSGNLSDNEFITKQIDVASSGYYYLKVSAFKNYPAGTLEGQLSEWASAHVSN